ncbi:hypothetical protein ABG067_004602 [Albugo candida]
MDLAYCRYTSCQCFRLHSLYLQGMVAATTDYFVYRFGCRYFDQTTAKWILFCHLSCWFTFYTLVRTYSNCMETLFTMMALSYWPWNFLMEEHKKDDDSVLANANWESDRFKALCYAAIGVLFRPTNAVLWVFLGCKHWLAVRSRFEFITFNVLPIGVLTTSIMIIIDYLYYKKWTFVPYNFVLFNLLQVWQKKLI